MLTCVSFVSVADESNIGSLVGNTAGETNADNLHLHMINVIDIERQ